MGHRLQQRQNTTSDQAVHTRLGMSEPLGHSRRLMGCPSSDRRRHITTPQRENALIVERQRWIKFCRLEISAARLLYP